MQRTFPRPTARRSIVCLALAAFLATQVNVLRAQDQVSDSSVCASLSCDELTCDSTGCDAIACDSLGCDGLGVASSASMFPALANLRGNLADSGITFQNSLTQFYMGTTAGGLSREFRYGGHGDYVTNVDFGKLGIRQGLFLKVRAEHRFGESIGQTTGSLLPSNLAADLPVADSEKLYLTNVLFTQALTESFVLFAGKIDTIDGDVNAYAHGRGIRQFSNTGFVANPIALRTTPYSTLAAGFSFLLEGQPLFTFSILNATNTTGSDGFSELFAEGAALTSELRLPTSFFDLPGHQLIGGTWSSRNFVSLGQDPRIILPTVPIARESGSWSLYWNCDQALVGDQQHNWGYFARAGIAEDQANPLAYFLSAGLGGSSPLSGRESDSFGVGYYVIGTSDNIAPVLQNIFGQLGNGQATELFYNLAVSPSLTITPDIQILDSARANVDTALVAGIRANLAF